MRLAVQWLPLLLCCWAGSAGAAADCAPSSGTFAINSSNDVNTLNECTTFDGNVTIAGTGIRVVTLNGLQSITGTFRITDAENLLSISSTTLEAVPTLILNNLPKLSTLTLPALTDFSKLDFTGLTALTGCEIATGSLQSDVKEVSIINTAIENMDWLKWPVATTMTIAANMKLTEFKLPYDRISVGSSYQISINSALVNLDFSQLTGIYGSLAINGNNDSQLSFDKLETIDGYVRLTGAFSNITMPVLSGINGALRAESTVNIISFCNWLSTQDQFYGHYDCTANNTSPITSSTDSKSAGSTAVSTSTVTAPGAQSTDDKSNSKKSDLSTGAIVGIAVALVIVISIILTASGLLLLRRRAQKKAQAGATPQDRKTLSTSTLGDELAASGVHYELGGEKKTTYEMPGAEPSRELDGESLQELDCERSFFRDQKPAPASPIGRFELP